MSRYYGDSLTIVWKLKYTITGCSFGSLRQQTTFPDANTNFFAKWSHDNAGNQWHRRKSSAVFSGYRIGVLIKILYFLLFSFVECTFIGFFPPFELKKIEGLWKVYFKYQARNQGPKQNFQNTVDHHLARFQPSPSPPTWMFLELRHVSWRRGAWRSPKKSKKVRYEFGLILLNSGW